MNLEIVVLFFRQGQNLLCKAVATTTPIMQGLLLIEGLYGLLKKFVLQLNT